MMRYYTVVSIDGLNALITINGWCTYLVAGRLCINKGVIFVEYLKDFCIKLFSCEVSHAGTERMVIYILY